MDAFFNLALFLVVFYLITLYAGWPDRRQHRADQGLDARNDSKRVA